MKVVVLTSTRRSAASRCLPVLQTSHRIDVVGVIFAESVLPNRRRQWRRKIAKVAKVGILGALNGIRLRRWFVDPTADDIETVSSRCGIPFFKTEAFDTDETRQCLNDVKADLGCAVACAYIPESVFALPKHGTINVHGELLPAYQNAQSVVWPIYNNDTVTGLTIHQIDKGIDTGPILYQEQHPIIFCSSLKATVTETVRHVAERVPAALRYVCENYSDLRANAIPQARGPRYTTPSAHAFLRMIRNNKLQFRRNQRQTAE